MTGKVDPALVAYGDRIDVNGHEYVVKAIQGPDSHGTYDFYLTDGKAETHQVIAEAVTVIYWHTHAVFTFRVDGSPVSQGSMKVINGYAIHSAGAALAVWRSSIALAAKLNQIKKFEGPVAMTLDFEVKKPRTVKRDYPTVPPDLDKLIRAVLDALTGIAYHDDAQVVHLITTKIYSENPGVQVSIKALESVI